MEAIQSIIDFISCNASALIALSALGLAVWQGIVLRKHNRLSVKPHLVFDRVVYNTSPQLQIFLSNTGVGPAVISSFQISLDGNPVEFQMEKIWDSIAKQFRIPATWGGGKIYCAGEAIKAGGKERLFALKTTDDEKDPDFVNELAHKELDRIQIIIEYESIYGEKHVESFNKT